MTQTGLSGSSAIVCAALSCLLDFYKVKHLIKVDIRPNLILNAEKELGIIAGLQDRVAQVYGGVVFMVCHLVVFSEDIDIGKVRNVLTVHFCDFLSRTLTRNPWMSWGMEYTHPWILVFFPHFISFMLKIQATLARLVAYHTITPSPYNLFHMVLVESFYLHRVDLFISHTLHWCQVHSTVRQRWLDGDEFIKASMEEVANLALEGHKALTQKDHTKLASLMNRNFDLRR